MIMIPKKRIIIILPVVVIAAVLTILLLRKWSGNDENVIKVSGNIEVKDAQIGFKIAGRVLERMVSEGELLDAGQIVARLDNLDLAQEVALRKAERRAAQASLAELEAGYRTAVCHIYGYGISYLPN